MCAMSTMRSAPTESAICRKRGKSSVRGYADAPAMMSFGFSASAVAWKASQSIVSVSFETPYETTR